MNSSFNRKAETERQTGSNDIITDFKQNERNCDYGTGTNANGSFLPLSGNAEEVNKNRHFDICSRIQF